MRRAGSAWASSWSRWVGWPPSSSDWASWPRRSCVTCATRAGESVQLYVREDDARRCVVSLQSPHALRWIVPEGSLLPLGVGSAGRVLTGAPLSPGGWIESVEEREAGVASVSAPVHDARGAVLAAVGISGPVERLTRSPGERFGVQVADAARRSPPRSPHARSPLGTTLISVRA